MKSKKWMIILLVFCLGIGSVVSPMNTEAKTKDVTSTMAKNKYIKKISKAIGIYTCEEILEPNGWDPKTSTKKEVLKGYNVLSITAFVSFGTYYETSWTKKEIHKRTKDLFGKTPKVTTIPSYYSSSRRWICTKYSSYQKKPYVYAGGEFGDCFPNCKVKKVVKVKKGVYDVTILNRMEEGEENRIDKIGKTKIRIKKNKKSAFKYNITKLQYKGI